MNLGLGLSTELIKYLRFSCNCKNNETHENLSKQFSDHTITRIYQLLIWGKLRPSTGRIDTFITRSSKNRQLMEVSQSKGKQAITNYKTVEIFENIKLQH